MKGKVVLILILFVLSGCNLNNNPTSKVEEVLSNYQGLNKNIVYDYKVFTNQEEVDSSLEKKYIDVIKNQYQNMTYEIKEETIDGNYATITTEIEVKDFTNIINNYGTITNHEEYLKELNNQKDKVTYTVDFTVTKKDNTWVLDALTEEVQKKTIRYLLINRNDSKYLSYS